jgi:Undecaprenyl-phosphate galactose phosphotransferase WbaP
MTGAIAQPALIARPIATKPYYMFGVLILTDAIALVASVALSVGLKFLFQPHVDLAGYIRLWPFLFVFLAFYSAVGLYSGAALTPPEELRRATFSSAFLFPVIGVLTATWRGPSHFLTWTMILAMLLSVVMVPLLRAQVRICFARKDWWGYPTVIFGAGDTAKLVAETLMSEVGFGLKPVAIFDQTWTDAPPIPGVPVLRDFALAAEVASNLRAPYAVIAIHGETPESVIATIESYISPYFARILIIPDLFRWSSLSIKPKSFGDILGLEVVQQAALPDRQLPKRILDVVVSSLVLLFLTPVLVAIAIAIKLETRGPVIFGHVRIGRNGMPFKAWKFRTMVSNSEEILDDYLASNPRAMAEWERDHKLRNDPRVTLVGRVLRRTSLDELPQLWNVLMSEMSLVGPRPIVEAEIPKYGATYSLYTRVKGGVTGLWQVSGRNDISYETRVKLDSFYVRNWSVWLDLCILYKTIGTVLFRNGAY